MKKTISKAQAVFVLGCLLANACAGKKTTGGEAPPAPSPATTEAASTSPNQKFSDAELDELLAPIALYPDPLLAQMAPASTFIDQLIEADRVLGGKSDDNLIANQSWDVSVKSVAHYPQVLQMMAQKSDWTTTLGQAYVNQPSDVGNSIQRLRAEARAAGYLVTTSQQEVITEGQVIRIEPAQPQVIYVPQYNPEVVYVDSGPSTGTVVATAIAFGVGLAIGAWLNNDWDYYGRGVYYHGWVGGGWIGRNRTYVNVNRSVYVNNSYRNINVNRTVVNRNTSSYRTNLTRDANVRRDRVNAGNRRDVNNNNRANVNPNDRNRSGAADRTRSGPENRKAGSGDRSKASVGAGAGANRSRPSTGAGAGINKSRPSTGAGAGANRSRPSTGAGAGANRSRPSTGGAGANRGRPSTGAGAGANRSRPKKKG